MKINADSPELTAYALGELTDEQRRQVEEAIAADPALQAEVDGIRSAISLLETEMAAESRISLSGEQRQNILETAASDALVESAAPSRGRTGTGRLSGWFAGWGIRQWAMGLAISGAAALLCAVAIWRQPSSSSSPRELKQESDEGSFRYGENRRTMQREAESLAEAKTAKTPESAKKERDAERPKDPLADLQDKAGSGAAELKKIRDVELRLSQEKVPAQRGPAVVTTGNDSLPPVTLSIDPAQPTTPQSGIGSYGAGGGFGGAAQGLDSLSRQQSEPARSAEGVLFDRSKSKLATAPPSGAGGFATSSATPPAQDGVNQPTVTTRFGLPPQGDVQARRTLSLQAPADQLAEQKLRGESASPRYFKDTTAAGRSLDTGGLGVERYSLAYQPPGNASVPPVTLKSESREEEVLSRRSYTVDTSRLTPAIDPYKQESYPRFVENPFQDIHVTPLSTFSLDVDTASYANVRRFLREGVRPPADAVRIEEMLNYFPYYYPAPKDGKPFGVQVEVAECPWNTAHRLIRIALKARDVERAERPRANLVFLIDVSGSMEPENKLPLVKQSLHLLLEKLNDKDRVGIVTYAGEAKVAMEPTPVTDDGRARLLTTIDQLRAAHGTHGSAGIQTAYAMASNNLVAGGINRILLCTDGDFNIGITSREELLSLISMEAKSGVFLSVLGYGMDNYKDATMELLADRGNGNYAYIDSFREAQKTLVHQMEGTLQTVAKDVKAQIEFNPARVQSWRQIGYEKRRLADRDFNDDSKDAGEVGAGHSITVLYEVASVPGHEPGVDPLRYAGESKSAVNSDNAHTDELFNLKLRYKEPDGAKSKLIEMPIRDSDQNWDKASADFKFAAAVAGFGQLLKDSSQKGDATLSLVLQLAEQGLGEDREGWRAEFVDLVRAAQKIMGN